MALDGTSCRWKVKFRNGYGTYFENKTIKLKSEQKFLMLVSLGQMFGHRIQNKPNVQVTRPIRYSKGVTKIATLQNSPLIFCRFVFEIDSNFSFSLRYFSFALRLLPITL